MRIAIALGVSLLLNACGGGAFTSIDAPPIEATDSGAERAAPPPPTLDGSPEAAPDAAPAPAACLTDLSNVGAGDFRVAFTLTTTELGTPLALLGQRASCDDAAPYWAVTLSAQGGIEATTQGAAESPAVTVEAGNSVNDGAPHQVVIARAAGRLGYWRDGVLGSSLVPDDSVLGVMAPLSVGASACPDAAPLAGHAELSDVCLTTP